MSVFFYNIFLLFLNIGIRIASLFNSKAKKWVEGREKIFERLKEAIPQNEPIIWIHCASLGEFEQGRPLVEKLKQVSPQHKILLTFFSPSGYEVQKNYKGADWVFYLPADGAANARRFLEIVKPGLVIFVKYEFWYYYLKKIKYRNIPLLLVSALFRKDMSFFKWYGGLQRKMLSRFDHLFVQNEESKLLIDNIGLAAICSISGDTRFDRVIEIAEKFEPIPLVETFIGTSKSVVAGSTWREDEEILYKTYKSINDQHFKWIIAPHEINEGHIQELLRLFPEAVLFSRLSEGKMDIAGQRILIIDNIGMLSRLYRYAYVAYVGGGHTSNGVHNVLEAAVYGKPVYFGPYFEKYREAVGLVKSGGAFPFHDEKELSAYINIISESAELYEQASTHAKAFVFGNRGATGRIIQFIQEKRLLTN